MCSMFGISDFVRRQTPESRFSHFDGTWFELLDLVQAAWDRGNYHPGYRPGVFLVSVSPLRFKSGVVDVTDTTQLVAKFDARRPTEAPFLHIEAIGGEKLPAKVVDIVVYAEEVLNENGECSTGTDYEIVSINARATLYEEPLTPMAMARNFLGLPGGTAAEYSAAQFAEAIIYWSTRTMRG